MVAQEGERQQGAYRGQRQRSIRAGLVEVGQSRGGRPTDEPATHLGRLGELPGSDEVAGLGQAHLGDVLVMAAEELLVMAVTTRERVRR